VTPREQLLFDLTIAIRDRMATGRYICEDLAEAALRVIEAPAVAKNETYAICTCGQNGFPENSPYSNHDHAADCPQSSK
jgi:hypothetical protein